MCFYNSRKLTAGGGPVQPPKAATKSSQDLVDGEVEEGGGGPRRSEEGAEEQRDGRGGTDAAPTIETMAGSRCGDPLPRGPLARSGLRCHRGGRWSQRSPPQRPPRAAG
ncbi:unnamed protein product [Prorocentrum cordatum]|uniref:Uncharacterized protein n=1 Tax=Prorocentrum cordatum TaxID=2364126 RepID=A0ABN9SYA4_9DINO|nr:unnamed protein product [Polarella glacialis]